MNTKREKAKERRVKFQISFECENTKLEEKIYEDDWMAMNVVEKMHRLTSMVILTSQALRAIQNVVDRIRSQQKNKKYI